MKVDFIATVITPWHLVGVKAYLLKLKEEKNNNITGLIYVEPHVKNGVLIDDEMLMFDNEIDCIHIKEKEEIYDYVKNDSNQDIKILSANFPDIKLCHQLLKKMGVTVKSVVVDEGVGCYDASKIRWLKSVYIDTHSIKKSVKFLVKRVYENILKYIENIDVEYFTLFNYSGENLVQNKNVCDFYAKSIKSKKENIIDVKNKPYVILFTNPLEEEGNVLGEDLKLLYNKIAKVIKNNGYNLVVRTHPRETCLDKYKDFHLLIEKADSSESLLARLNYMPEFVIGAHSTSLVTAKLFFGIKAITLGNMITPICKTAYCKDLIKKYELNFKNVIEFPKSIEELEAYIRGENE